MQRVRLTPVTIDDVPAVHRFKNDRELQLLSQDSFAPESLSQTEARLGLRR